MDEFEEMAQQIASGLGYMPVPERIKLVALLRRASRMREAVSNAPCGRGEVLWTSTGDKCSRAPRSCNCWKTAILHPNPEAP